MNALTIFTYAGNDLRVIDRDGNPWFVAADVIRILYGSTNNGGTAYSLVNEDERSYVNRKHVGLPPGKPAVIISESGLYRMIMRSDKPAARAFQDWVTRDVLPAIRKSWLHRPLASTLENRLE